jgi:transketolase
MGRGGNGFALGKACPSLTAWHWLRKWTKLPYRVYALLGDGEVAEGGVWEAIAFASYYKLDNLTAIVDVNRLGQSAPDDAST